MSVRRIASIVGVVAAAMLGAGAAHSADPVKIRHAWIVPVTNIASMMFAKPELAKHNGKSYVFEAVRFQGSPPMVTALAAGEIEVALLAWSSIGIAIENAGLHDVRVVADEVREGVGDKSFTHQYMVLKDGPIQKVEDLKGKTLATNAMGAAVDIAMRAMLRKHGLEHRRDYNIVETGFPNMKAMLMEKKVDLIPGILPFALDPELRGAAKVLFTEKDAMGPSELAFLTMRADFIAKNRAAIVDFLEDYIRAMRYWTDPKNRDEMLKVAVDVSKRPAETWASWVYLPEDYYRDRNAMPDLDVLQSNLETQRDLGFLKTKIDIKKYADLSMVQEAVKRLQ
jgi:NitT/TauT family transport system substrate-binding protein